MTQAPLTREAKELCRKLGLVDLRFDSAGAPTNNASWAYLEIHKALIAAAHIQHEGWRPKYRVKDEHGQTIAITQTKWTADKLVEGIKADGGLTSQLGSWSIELLSPPPQQDGKEEARRHFQELLDDPTFVAPSIAGERELPRNIDELRQSLLPANASLEDFHDALFQSRLDAVFDLAHQALASRPTNAPEQEGDDIGELLNLISNHIAPLANPERNIPPGALAAALDGMRRTAKQYADLYMDRCEKWSASQEALASVLERYKDAEKQNAELRDALEQEKAKPKQCSECHKSPDQMGLVE